MKFLVVLILFFIHGFLKAQVVSDIECIRFSFNESLNAEYVTEKKITLHKSPLNPFRQLSYVFLFAYQKVLSEQIAASCEFQPSCSSFSIQSIQGLGFLKGIILTADRLTRCNGAAQLETENYLINHRTGKVIDVPQAYSFK